MKRLSVVAALLVLVSMAADAGTVNLTWTNPTTNTDGSAIGPILSTRLEYGGCSGASFGTKSGEWVNTGAGAASISPNLAAGTWCFRAYTKTANGESGPSNVAQKVLAPPPPNSPTNLLTDPNSLVAYGIQQTLGTTPLADGQFRAFAVATVAANTPCDGTTSANGMFKVPKSAVTSWYGDVRPGVIFAQCVPSGG